MWEDPANKLGGKWIISCASADLSAKWEATVRINTPHTQYHIYFLIDSSLHATDVSQLLAIVGEQFHPYGKDICGAVMAKRTKGDKISLWTRNFADREGCMHIGCVLQFLDGKLIAQAGAAEGAEAGAARQDWIPGVVCSGGCGLVDP